jgi:hypothetical protein
MDVVGEVQDGWTVTWVSGCRTTAHLLGGDRAGLLEPGESTRTQTGVPEVDVQHHLPLRARICGSAQVKGLLAGRGFRPRSSGVRRGTRSSRSIWWASAVRAA